MSSDSDQQYVIDDLVRRKKRFREYMRNLSPTEKIRALESLQRRTYELLKVREENGGRPIPADWRRWRRAQDDLGIKK